MLQRRQNLDSNRHLNDKGYSLVEMIIVIAIIAVLTGIAFITLSLLSSAKAKEAGVTFESEIADVISKSRGQLPVIHKDDGSVVKDPKYYYCLMFYQVADGRNFIKSGYYDSSTNDFTADSSYIFTQYDNGATGQGREISSKVYVKYTDVSDNTVTIANTGANTVDKQYIVFDTNGKCVYGYGTYSFYKKNGSNVSNVSIKKNGSHQSN